MNRHCSSLKLDEGKLGEGSIDKIGSQQMYQNNENWKSKSWQGWNETCREDSWNEICKEEVDCWIAVDSSVKECEKFTRALFGYDSYAEVIEIEIASTMEESFAMDMFHKEFLFR